MDKKTADPMTIARASADAMLASDRPSNGFGMKLCSIAPGTATMSMIVRDDMINGNGTCHGGVIFTLADSAFAYACNSHGPVTVAASADISFLKAPVTGDTLYADARETYREGRNGICDVKVTDQHGDTIAMFRGKSRTIKGHHPVPDNQS